MSLTLDNPTTTEPDAEPAPVLEVALSTAIKSAAAMLTSAAPKDELTEPIRGAHFDGSTLYATDRYKVARFVLPTVPARKDDRLTLGSAFLIPRAALEWVAKIALSSLRHKAGQMGSMNDHGYTVRYEHDAEAKSVTASVIDMFGKTERSQAFNGIAGNFPPVARLFPDESIEPGEPGTQAFNPTYMGLILAYCAKYGNGKNAPFKITLYGDASVRKLHPALIEGAGASFLLQPNLNLR